MVYTCLEPLDYLYVDNFDNNKYENIILHSIYEPSYVHSMK